MLTKDALPYPASYRVNGSEKELSNAVENSNADFGFVFEENGKVVYKLLKTNIQDLAVSKLQPALDEILADCKKLKLVCK